MTAGRRLAVLGAAMMLLLSGCGWMDGSYVSVTPHRVAAGQSVEGDARAVGSYMELRGALVSLIDDGVTEGLFSLAEYPREKVLEDMDRAVEYAMGSYPIGAYAVESIDYDFGTGLGASAISVDITYRRSREELARIRTVRWRAGAEGAIAEAMDECAQTLVIQMAGYQETDFAGIAREYAWNNPDRVMEMPQISVQIYPDRGDTRVVELTFQYRTDRDTLRAMREQVQPVFSSAALYVSGQAQDSIKYAQLQAFLTERFDYTIQSSATPAYDLLCQGMGDSRAFAQIYAAMCSRIGLEARTVRGTRNGETHWWNLVKVDGAWRHLDLLASAQYRPMTDSEMTGYDWDRTAYPAAESGSA